MTNKKEIESSVISILNEIFDKNEQDYSHIKDFYQEGYMDSIQMMELILGLEERFGIEFPDEDLSFEKFMSLQLICESVYKRV